jgi:hypothetical protein
MAVIKSDDVVDAYSEVVPGGAAYADQYLPWVQASIQEQQLPVRMQVQETATGLLKSVMGKKRPFLVVQPDSRALDEFRQLNYAVPLGTNLAVGWYLLGRNPEFGKASFRIPVIHGMDLFDLADLEALVSTLHQHAVMRTVMHIVEQAGVNPKTIKTQSQGLFNVS